MPEPELLPEEIKVAVTDQREALRRFLNEMDYAGLLQPGDIERVLKDYDALTEAIQKKPEIRKDYIASVRPLLQNLLDLAMDTDPTVRQTYIKRQVNAQKAAAVQAESQADYLLKQQQERAAMVYPTIIAEDEAYKKALADAKAKAKWDLDLAERSADEENKAEAEKRLRAIETAENFLIHQEAQRRQDKAEAAAKAEAERIEKHYAYLREQQRQQAKAGLFLPPKELPAPYQQPGMPSGAEKIAPFLSQLSPNLQEFWRGREEEILSPIAAARQLWLDTLHAPAAAEFQAAQAEEQAATSLEARVRGGITPLPQDASQDIVASAEKATRELIEERMGTDPEYLAALENLGTTRRATKPSVAVDPLDKYLQEFSFTAPYLKYAPRQRGEYPAIVAPKAVWGPR